MYTKGVHYLRKKKRFLHKEQKLNQMEEIACQRSKSFVHERADCLMRVYLKVFHCVEDSNFKTL